MNTHLVVGDAHGRDCISIRPHVVLHKLHAFLLEILATIAECLPVLFPFLHRLLQHTRELGIIILICLYCLLSPLQLKINLFKVLALHECALGSVRIDTDTVGLVLFASLGSMLFACLLYAKLFFDGSLVDLFVLLLFGSEGSNMGFEVGANLLGQLRVTPSLFVCL